jgi:hypothetical protein
MRYGRALLAGLGWVGTLGGLALCVLIFLSAYLAFDDRGAGVASRRDEIIRLPSVPEAEVPRVPLGRPPARIAGSNPQAPLPPALGDTTRAQPAGAAGPVSTRRSQRSEWPCSSASC